MEKKVWFGKKLIHFNISHIENDNISYRQSRFPQPSKAITLTVIFCMQTMSILSKMLNIPVVEDLK